MMNAIHKFFKYYVFNVLIGIDQLINTILGGYPDETISARCYRNYDTNGWWMFAHDMINCISFLLGQRRHCYNAWLSECQRIQYPEGY